MPRLSVAEGSYSDGRAADAEGTVITFEWLGFIVEWSFYRRGRA